MGPMTTTDTGKRTIISEPQPDGAKALSDRLNWLRAGVLGANDGIVSVGATLVGVAAATPTVTPVLLAGIAAVVGGAISMALGEFVSVSSAADSQRSLISRVTELVLGDRAAANQRLVEGYREQGISESTAELIVADLSSEAAVRAHLHQDYGLDEDEVLNPGHAAYASAIAFLAGALLPLLTIILLPIAWRIPITIVAVIIALAVTGGLGAKLGGAPIRPAIGRVVVGGAIALVVTWGIGSLLGVVVG